MSWSTMSSRDRRAVTIGALVLLPPLLFIFGVRPYMNTLADAREQLITEREALARERAALTLARKNPQLQHLADSAMRQMEPRLFAGRDDVMASAELASYLADVARGVRVWVQDAATREAIAVHLEPICRVCVIRAVDLLGAEGNGTAELPALRAAAAALRAGGARAVLVAGAAWHGRIVDLLDEEGAETVLDTARVCAPRVAGLASAHAAALAAHLAHGRSLLQAAEAAQRYVAQRLQRGR